MDALRLDLRSAIRSLAHKPGYALLAVLTLAVGIGVNTVAFSALNAFLFKPVRFPGSERLGWITTQAAGNPYGQTSWPDYEDLARDTGAFEGIAAEGRVPLSMRTDGRAEQIWSLLCRPTTCPCSRRGPRSAASSRMPTAAGPRSRRW